MAAAKVAALLGAELKQIDALLSGYESDLSSLIQELLRGGHRLSKADFRRQMKGQIRDYAREGFRVAWEEGGGDVAELESDELSLIQEWTKEQQGFINDFSDWLTAKESDLDTIPDRVELWTDSFDNFMGQAKARAMGDPPLRFDGDDGEESCDECQEWKGQVHRLSFWEKRELTKRNGNDNFGCKRFDNCHHSFFHTKTGEMVIP